MQRILSLILGSVCLASCATDAQEAAAPSPLLLSWIEGCWVTEDGSSTDHWTRGHESLIFGFNTLIYDQELTFFEQMWLQRVEGAWQFAAYPRGVGPTVFEMIEIGEAGFVVENAENDFPQRIEYQRAANTLTARISLLDGSNATEWAFQACEG